MKEKNINLLLRKHIAFLKEDIETKKRARKEVRQKYPKLFK